MIALTRTGAAAAVAMLALAGAARADETQLSLAPAPSESPASIPPITIRVSVAQASEEEGEVDPRAKDIYEHLPARFHSIRMLEEKTIAVPFGERAQVDLPSGSSVSLLPVAVHHSQLHLQLEMPEVLNTSIRMSNSRAFYVGGVDYGGGTLIFKLVPQFDDYVDKPALARQPAAAPQTQPAGVKR